MLGERESLQLRALQTVITRWFRDRAQCTLSVPCEPGEITIELVRWARASGYLAQAANGVVKIVKVSRYGGRFTH
jgi:hypothetical protein